MILAYPLNIGFLSTTTLSGLKSVPMVGPAYEASISFSLLNVNRLQGREPVNKCQLLSTTVSVKAVDVINVIFVAVIIAWENLELSLMILSANCLHTNGDCLTLAC